MYGSQPPPHYAGGYQNPPQPEWQSHHSTPASTYNPNTYGPINPYSQTTSPPPPVGSTPNADTSSWGVRYNQHMAQEPPPPPPIPPRNPDLYSASPPPPPPPRPTSTSNPTPNATSWDYSNTYNTQEYNTTYNTQPAQSPPQPPPKPPLPAAYQNEINGYAQQWQSSQQNYGPQYSHHPPTHNYDPSPQPQPQPQPQSHIYEPVIHDQAQTNYQQTPFYSTGSPPPAVPMSSAPPAPPATASSVGTQWTSQPSNYTTGASILGHGGVSDWEHLNSTPGDVDDLELYRKKPAPGQPMAQSNSAAATPPPPLQEPPIYNSPQRHTPVSSQAMSPSSLDQTQTYPPRNNSTHSQVSLISPEDRSESIDGVIKAWNQHPVSPITKAQSETYPPSPASMLAKPASPAAATANPAATGPPIEDNPGSNLEKHTGQIEQVTSRVSTPVTTNDAIPSQVKILDPYDDLDPWSKSSLFRYVTMLRKEAVAESEEEKHKIFTGFVAKETRLREVLYNVESADKETKQASSTVPLDTRKSSEDLVATANQLKKYLEEMKDMRLPPLSDDHIPVESEDGAPHSRETGDDSEDPDDVPYSPGGRPILNKKLPAQALAKKQEDLRRLSSNPQGLGTNSVGGETSSHAPSNAMTGQDVSSIGRSTSVPPASTTSSTTAAALTPLVPEPPQPAYTPFRYTEGPQRGSETLSVAQPGYQAYSALRQASAESGRAMSAAPLLQTPADQGPTGLPKSTGSIQTDETFLGIIREKSVSYRGKNELVGSESGFEELGALIPDPFPTLEESVEISNIRKKMDVYSDDFRYIYVTTETWELAARDRREKLERDRVARQEVSEAHIDSLFNEKEIGYADINPLEEQFRQGEARTQLAEERKELDNFIRKVYNPVDIRLKEEIVELKALHQRALDELSHDKIHSNSNSKYQISRTMKTINTLSNKLEARYQKRLDLGLNREHHRKRAERRPLVFLGDSRALKKLDADFEKMEKQNVVEAAKDRDERANKLTDVFDGAILHALGNHQRVLDDTAAKMRKLDVGMVERSSLSEADKELLLRSISALTKFLAEDAESMLTSFKEADTLLNEADYKVSVAEAQYANSDPEVFRRLEDEKKKEDDKIQEDHSSKLESIKKAPAEISSKVDQILSAMNKEPGVGPGPWRRPASLTTNTTAAQLRPESQSQSRSRSRSPSVLDETNEDRHIVDGLMPGPLRLSAETEQQERLRKALEDAKKRNAAKNYTA
ncbi:hypothetical protein UA08_03900 [Talaromyces atroroseus]|uniref:Uncharacterized protein n=1 Tax=Talaromyces atroroseus TaxID=1441469 RepID=A0A225AJA8_TALAT|nr:hypothetical protein UA08_03900 [Talaromyces atroroseus]OKL61561.1 hypothetical protein UA08_03900 [Talaromyces atroroseus]